jgi:hypothetical protein
MDGDVTSRRSRVNTLISGVDGRGAGTAVTVRSALVKEETVMRGFVSIDSVVVDWRDVAAGASRVRFSGFMLEDRMVHHMPGTDDPQEGNDDQKSHQEARVSVAIHRIKQSRWLCRAAETTGMSFGARMILASSVSRNS